MAEAREAQAADLFVIGGRGNGVDVASVGLRTGPWKSWTSEGGWEYALSGEVQIAGWRGRESEAAVRHIVDTSFTPVLSVRGPTGDGWRPYLEVGFGAHLLSHTQINDDRIFSTAFQFGEFLGTGVQLGERNQYAVGVRVQHISNGGIKKPNNGITFGEVLLQYHYQ